MRKSVLKRKTVTLTLAIMLLTFSLAEPAFAQATTFTTNVFEPFAEIVENPCANGGAGEDVLITGIRHIQMHETLNGNRRNFKFHIQRQRVMSLGLTTGDVYRGATLVQSDENFPLPDGTGASSSHIVNHFILIGPGPGNNLRFRVTFHLTVNANGEFTSFVDKLSIVCN